MDGPIIIIIFLVVLAVVLIFSAGFMGKVIQGQTSIIKGGGMIKNFFNSKRKNK